MQQPEFGSRAGHRRRRVVRLLTAAVGVYWVALAVLAVWSPVRLYLRLRQRWPGHVTLGVSDRYGFAVTLNERPVWQATLTGLQAAVWIIGPPLLLWLLWLVSTRGRTRRPGVGPETRDAGGGARSGAEAPSVAELSAGAKPPASNAAEARDRERPRAPADRAG
jgi:hypothetical protein